MLLHKPDSHLWRSCDNVDIPDPVYTTVSTSIITSVFIIHTFLTFIIYIKIYCVAHTTSERTRKCSLRPTDQISSDSLPTSVRHRISNAGQMLYREEGRTAAVYMISAACNIVCWSPVVISRLWPQTIPPLLVLSLAVSYSIISPAVFAGR